MKLIVLLIAVALFSLFFGCSSVRPHPEGFRGFQGDADVTRNQFVS